MTCSPHRILFVSHEVEFGGAERSLIGLLSALDRSEFAAELACSEDGPLAAAARGLDLPVHFVPMRFRGRARKARGLLQAGSALARLCEDRGIAVLHANTLIAGYAAARATRLAAARFVWHVRDVTYPALARWATRRADRVIANSRATAATLGRRDNVAVVYNGIEPAFFTATMSLEDRADRRRALGLPIDATLVLTLGRLDPQKGHVVLLDAAARMQAAPHFVIVGDVTFDAGRSRFGDLKASLERDAAARGLATRVHLLGQRDDAAEIASVCDVLAHPTLRHEAFGRAIAEAAAAGIPAVASAIGGIPEIVDHEISGLLVAPGDPTELATALDRVCSDPNLRSSLGTAARATARHCFTIPAHAAGVERVYRSLLGLDMPGRLALDARAP